MLVLFLAGAVFLEAEISMAALKPPGAVVDSSTNSTMLQRGRFRATATVLNDGRVLVVGGVSGRADSPIASTEIYDPKTKKWSMGPRLLRARSEHTATLLENGAVLVVGGKDNQGVLIVTTEILNAGKDTWIPGPPMSEARKLHTAVRLPSGAVLVSGGRGNRGTLALNEVYNPVHSTWMTTAPMASDRAEHAAVLLPSGRVLAIGGFSKSLGGREQELATAEIFDPETNTWSQTDPMFMTRPQPVATVLKDGRVLVTGGHMNLIGELFDEKTMAWLPTRAMPQGSELHSQILLPNGQVYLAGGMHSIALTYQPDSNSWKKVEPIDGNRIGANLVQLADQSVLLISGGRCFISGSCSSKTYEPSVLHYKPNSTTWTIASDLPTPRRDHIAAALPDGRVLIAGGTSVFHWSTYLDYNSVEIFDPAHRAWISAAPMLESRIGAASATLRDGRVMVIGGESRVGNSQIEELASVEVYDSKTGVWSYLAPMNQAHAFVNSLVLDDGRIMIYGGLDHELASGEIYDPAANVWKMVAEGPKVRYSALARLPDGRVLLTGGAGYEENVVSARCWIFDPKANSWTETGSLLHPRGVHTATTLPNGQVLVAGGTAKGSLVAPTEVYDVSFGKWQQLPNILVPRRGHTAIQNGHGQVILFGGTVDSLYEGLTDVEVFDFVTGQWSSLPPLQQPVGNPSVTLMAEGGIFVFGGDSDGIVTPQFSTYLFE
jgi:N-acetylneuraminic acid mutarotase